MAEALAPELAKKTLPLALTDELPASRAVSLVASVSRLGEQPALAWEFAQAQRIPLGHKLDSLGRVRFAPGVMRGFSDVKRASELEAYAQKNLPSEAKSEIAKAAEEIRFKADLKARILPEIARWIATKTPKAIR